jgi:hypothetical protein
MTKVFIYSWSRDKLFHYYRDCKRICDKNDIDVFSVERNKYPNYTICQDCSSRKMNELLSSAKEVK